MCTYVKRKCQVIHGDIALGRIANFNHGAKIEFATKEEKNELFREINEIIDDTFIQYGEIHRRLLNTEPDIDSILDFVFPVFDTASMLEKFQELVVEEGLDLSTAFKKAVEAFLSDNKGLIPKELMKHSNDIYKRIDFLQSTLMVRFECMTLQRKFKSIDYDFVLVVDSFKKEYYYNLPRNIQAIICRKIENQQLGITLASSYEIPLVVHDFDYIEGDLVVIDKKSNSVIIKPDNHMLIKYQESIHQLIYTLGEEASYGPSHIKIYAPMVDTKSLDRISSGNWYNGVAPFKSEFMYVTKGITPTVDEQYDVFYDIMKAMIDKDIYIRIPDFRPERPTEYLGNIYTDIQTFIEFSEVYNINLRAIAKAARDTQKSISVIIPMIRMNSEIPFWRTMINAAFEMYHIKTPEIGIMIETESTFEYHEEYTQIDFAVIGLNDLFEEMTDDINRYDHLSKTEFLDTLWPEIRDLHQNLRSYKMQVRHIVSGNFLSNPEILYKLLKSGFTEFCIPVSQIKKVEHVLKAHVESIGQYKGVAQKRKENKIAAASQSLQNEIAKKEIGRIKQEEKEKQLKNKEQEQRDQHKEKREEVIQMLLEKKKNSKDYKEIN